MLVAHTEKFIKRFLIAGVFFVFLLCLFLGKYEMRINVIEGGKYTKLHDENIAHINLDNAYWEQIDTDKYYLEIEGWCVLYNCATQHVTMSVVLQESGSDICYELPTTIITRANVTEFINDGTNYDNSGFKVNMTSSEFKFDEKDYNVLILYGNGTNSYLIDSGEKVSYKCEE